MTFKKTLTVSIIFHVCFFSAALIFSAGFFTGSGERLDQPVIFVSLSHEGISTPGQEVNDQNRAAPSLPQPPQRKISHAGVTEEVPETVKEDVAEVPVGVVEEKAAETREPVIDEARDVRSTDDSEYQEPNNQEAHEVTDARDDPALANSIDSSRETDNMQTSYSSDFTESLAAASGQQWEGVTPGIIELIGSAIERVKTYPALARKRGIEGTVQVSFRITLTGEPDEIRIMKSSGFGVLDRATLRVVKKAAPYPHMDRRVEVPVAYTLRERG